ncbi:MAG: MerR family transcriptional regulator [Bacteroidales bacterium]
MTPYSINDLEKITGIKAHTIRMWEKRYQVITPERTTTNIRYYFDKDLKRLLNISTLNKHGIKISHIVKMPETEIREKVMQINDHTGDYESQINSLVVSMIELDEQAFEKVLANNILKIGFEKTVTHVLYPFLEKIGLLWQIGTINPAQEHFIVGLIRNKIIVAIDGQEVKASERSKTFLLFLPEKELHELGLLFYYYLLKRNGHQVIYLGQSVPYKDLLSVLEIRKEVDYILTYFVSALKPEEAESYIQKMSSDIPGKQIFVTGWQINNLNPVLPSNVRHVKSTEEFKALLPSL